MKVAPNGGDRGNQYAGGKRQSDNITLPSEDRGTGRAYTVARLRKAAEEAEGVDPLFAPPEARKAADLLPRFTGRELSANAAALSGVFWSA